MPFSRLAEFRIREAMKEGAFDDLPNRGQPIDLDAYFALPADVRMSYSILKNANCVPEEVALINDVAAHEAELAKATTPEDKARLLKATEMARLRLSIAMEHRRRAARAAKAADR